MNATESQSNESPYFGVALALVFIVFGTILFLKWDYAIIELIGILLITFGIVGLGVETSNFTGSDGGVELGIGGGLAFFIWIVEANFPAFPDWISILLLLPALLFIFSSILRGIPFLKKMTLNQQEHGSVTRSGRFFFTIIHVLERLVGLFFGLQAMYSLIFG